MKLASFHHVGGTGIGVVIGDEIVDLAAAAPDLPREMRAFLTGGADLLDAASAAAEHAPARIPLDDVKLEAPILRPPKILAIGLNYADHVRESGMEPVSDR